MPSKDRKDAFAWTQPNQFQVIQPKPKPRRKARRGGRNGSRKP